MFDYDTAFSRNVGWITESEKDIIKNTKIAIAGLGGAGGEHALTLARMGFQHFHFADFDEFEIHNFNRQAGAFTDTVERPKCKVMAEMVKKINPNITVKQFNDGVNDENVDEFFEGVDIYVDGIDFFALHARLSVYRKAEEKGIPNLLAAPFGMGAAMAIFTPESMPFEQYYRFNDAKTDDEKFIKLLIGLGPALLQKSYLVDESTADFKEKKGPSTPMAIKLCSGMLVTNVLKLVLKRGEVIVAPKVQQFDAYKNKFVVSNSRWGTRGPLQRLKFKIAKAKVLK
ncbi:ThiF family adenylyltransferase [Glaciecola petra]|uniref:ThiF family adenylyltransferase n=1 Tax=Glaciecola petra TaxID=3075602 RepID=A0ABU2ZMZ2_9ALTE|nr:ThiF family adenylyltransferase [Aestuariibacter sp. P117]MDT0593621.1 ThiF family adenylyltransferase [Aestuariibacter sp. P117]